MVYFICGEYGGFYSDRQAGIVFFDVFDEGSHSGDDVGVVGMYAAGECDGVELVVVFVECFVYEGDEFSGGVFGESWLWFEGEWAEGAVVDALVCEVEEKLVGCVVGVGEYVCGGDEGFVVFCDGVGVVCVFFETECLWFV